MENKDGPAPSGGNDHANDFPKTCHRRVVVPIGRFLIPLNVEENHARSLGAVAGAITVGVEILGVEKLGATGQRGCGQQAQRYGN